MKIEIDYYYSHKLHVLIRVNRYQVVTTYYHVLFRGVTIKTLGRDAYSSLLFFLHESFSNLIMIVIQKVCEEYLQGTRNK